MSTFANKGVATRTRLLLAAALTLSAGMPAEAQAQAPGACPIGKAQYQGNSTRFHRGSLDVGGIPYRFTILLPSDYATSGRRYPVLYLFHGGGGHEESSMGTGATPPLIETISESSPVIVVMPDGGFIGAHSDWPDDPAQQWETFHIKRLVPYIDATYRTVADRAHRAVMGFSMGGFGAMTYAARHPGVFGAAGSGSGFPDTSRRTPDMHAALLPIVLALRPICTASQAPFGPWGDPVTGVEEWEAHNPTALVERLRGTLLFVESANGVPCDQEDVQTLATSVVPDFTNALEPQIRRSSRAFHEALVAAGVEHVYREAPCGIHSGRYFGEELRRWWPIMMRFFGEPAQAAPARAIRLRVRPVRVRSGRRRTFRFTVRAVEDGAVRPLAGAAIRFVGRRATTNRLGQATISAAVRRHGLRRVVASKRGFRRAVVRVRVT